MLFLKICIILFNFNLIFFSSIGYGLIFNKFFLKKENIRIYELFIYSIPFLLLLSFIIQYLSPINYRVTFIIITIGIFLSIINIKKLLNDRLSNYIYLFSFVIFIPFMVGGTPHADFFYHQLPYLNTIFNYKIIFGLVNFNDVLANPYMAWFDYSALFTLYPFKFQTNHIVNAVLFFSYINYLLRDYKSKEDINLKILNIFLIIIPLSLFSKLTDHGADIPAQLFILLTTKEFVNFFLTSKDEKKIKIFYKVILFTLTAIILRINSIFILPLGLILFFIVLKKNFNKKINFNLVIFLFILSSLFISKNFITSGCLVYPINQTCFSSDIVSWSVGKELTKKRADFLEASSKGWMFYAKTVSPEEDKFIWNPNKDMMTHEEYLDQSVFFWSKYWYMDHDKSRIINVMLISILIFLFIYIYNLKKIKINLQNKNFKKIIFLLLLIPIFFWFFKTPQSRFAGYSIFISFFSTLIIFIISKTINNRKIKINFPFLLLLCISSFYFLSENIILSKNNIYINKSNEIYDWTPYPKLIISRDFSQSKINDFNINLRLPTNKSYAGNINDPYKHILYCANIKQICMPIKKIDCLQSVNLKYSFIFTKPNIDSCITLLNQHILY